ncbi:ecto-ADP-ribosyltransferase 5-like [Xenopus tropicalis]|uniref:NAD(P)(+)--arginine ADP-ribosyltransferase n=2 Tax=Xenopus tropicalis TaxID=8364 RepID=A0A803KEJ3_XENTR|nr:ecto-ADP-ribosyltransferase 5-like [Xenopus tropicalis]
MGELHIVGPQSSTESPVGNCPLGGRSFSYSYLFALFHSVLGFHCYQIPNNHWPTRMDHLRRMWPIICLLNLPITAQAEWEEPRDPAGEAFDDQYLGCRTQMDLLMDEILEAEKSENKLLRRAWREAENVWNQQKKRKVLLDLPDGFRDSHGVALVAYSGFIKTYFNAAVSSAGESHQFYMERFRYKSLHFYLTVAVQLLSGGCKRVRTVFSGTDSAHSAPNATAQCARFGHFLSGYTERQQAAAFATGTVFTIRSCYGVQLERFSQFPQEGEVLVPGYELFRVSQSKEPNEFTFTSSRRTFSNFNCALIGDRKSPLNPPEQCSSSSSSSISSGTTGRILRATTTLLILSLCAVPWV